MARYFIARSSSFWLRSVNVITEEFERITRILIKVDGALPKMEGLILGDLWANPLSCAH